MAKVEAGVLPGDLNVAARRVVFVFPLPGADEFAEAVEGCGIEAERLAGFAGGGASAVGDDVGGHGGAELAVALIDVLNGALALRSAGQVEIDVRPLAALFRQEALEEQVHADGIDGGDAERVADHAVGRRAAPLHQNCLAQAELHDVPDDEEVSGEFELGDQRELALRLLLGAGKKFGVVLGEIAVGECPRRCVFQGTIASSRPVWDGIGRGSGSRGRSSGRRGGRRARRCWRWLRGDRGRAAASRAGSADSARRWGRAGGPPSPACSGGGWW